MADPVTMAAIGTYAQTAAAVVSAGTAAYTAVATGEAGQKKAAAESAWAERRANDERAAGQRQALEEKHKADLLQSRLGAVAGSSGSGAADPGVMDTWGDIERQGDVNAGTAQAMAENKANGITYQAALDRWSADANAKLGKVGAAGTLIGGLGKGFGIYTDGMAKTPMAMKYGGWRTPVQRGTGYS